MNLALGGLALRDNTSGIANVVSGFGALRQNTTGNTNVATGYDALFSNTTGSSNIGRAALRERKPEDERSAPDMPWS